MLFVISLIIFGMFLLIVEILLIPGITIAGIGGFLFIVGGIYLSYHNFGFETGNYVLLSTFILAAVLLYLALRSKTWKKLMLSTNVESKVNEIEEEKIHEGDIGKTVTRLAPIGKIVVHGIYMEGKSTGAFIDENEEIEVVKVLHNQVIVKLI